MEGSNFPQQFAVWGAEKKAQMCITEQTVQATRQESQSYWYATVAHKYMESEGELLNAWWEAPPALNQSHQNQEMLQGHLIH